MKDNNTSANQSEAEISKYINENTNLLSRVLHHGNKEARGYALALIANGGTKEDIEDIQQELEDLNESAK